MPVESLQPGYSTVPPGQSPGVYAGSLCRTPHCSSYSTVGPELPFSRMPNKSCSPTFGLKSNTSPLPLLILPVTVSLVFIPCCSLNTQLFFQGLFHKLILFPQTSLIYAAVFVWVSVPSLCLCTQPFILTHSFIIFSSQVYRFCSFKDSTFCYLMHKCMSRCNL